MEVAQNKEVENEGWKNIPNLPSYYEISTLGRVRFIQGKKNFILEPYKKGNHMYIALHVTAASKKEFKLVDLVLSTYRKEYFIGCRLLFKDFNPANCSVNNLRWKTPKQYHSSDNDGMDNWKCSAKAGSANARFKDKNSEKITKHDVYRALEIMQFKCFYCNSPLDANTWQLDHFTAVSNGGLNNFLNLCCSCKICNTMKGTLDGNQFYSIIDKISKSESFKNRWR